MKKRLISLLLVLALGLSLCAVSAVAGEEPEESAAAESTEPVAAMTEGAHGEASVEADALSKDDTADVSPAGPDAELGVELGKADPELAKLLEKVTIVPEQLESIAFADVERQMRSSSLPILTIQESIDAIQSIDYEELSDDLRESLNTLTEAQWGMVSAPLPNINIGGTTNIGGFDVPNSTILNQTLAQLQAASTASAVQTLGQTYATLREQFDAIRDGDMQEDNAGAVWQAKNGQDLLIMSGETLYLVLASLELQEETLQRQLASLNRTVEEMELRYNMGQISALQLSQTRAGQTTLASTLESLRMTIQNYKSQFEMLLGAEATGKLQLSAVPAVDDRQLASMDVEKDLLTAKANSYDLYAAAKTLEEAQEAYKEAGKNTGYKESKMEFRIEKHNWQAAQYTYNYTIQDFDLRFRTLYAQVLDYKQILDAAKVTLESETQEFAAAELKYQQGTISLNAYLTAQDDLEAAKATVTTASNDLFSSYNTYCWAVQHGILLGQEE